MMTVRPCVFVSPSGHPSILVPNRDVAQTLLILTVREITARQTPQSPKKSRIEFPGKTREEVSQLIDLFLRRKQSAHNANPAGHHKPHETNVIGTLRPHLLNKILTAAKPAPELP